MSHGIFQVMQVCNESWAVRHEANINDSRVPDLLETLYESWVELIERNTPPRGSFLFTMFPDQDPGGKGPPSKHMVQILRGGSSFSGFLIGENSEKETPPGGGGSFDQS